LEEGKRGPLGNEQVRDLSECKRGHSGAIGLKEELRKSTRAWGGDLVGGGERLDSLPSITEERPNKLSLNKRGGGKGGYWNRKEGGEKRDGGSSI